MKSTATTVPAYLAALPEDRRPSLTRLRALCRTSLKDCEETMQYGMPCYQRKGQMVICFASQKQYISVYVGSPAVVDAYRDRLGKLRVGRSCIRFTNSDQIDFALLGDIFHSVSAG